MNFEEKYKIGFPVFEKFFNMKKGKLIETLKSVLDNNEAALDILENNPTVTKEIINDTPSDIILSFYDIIKISPFGIKIKREHGNYVDLVKFNKHFTL